MNKTFLFFPTLPLLLLLLTSCSLRYGMTIYDDSNVPELTFTEVNFSRYENNDKTLEMNAGRLEQYKDGNSIYAKDLSFNIIKDKEVKTRGKCGLLSANTDDKKYVLYNDIQVENIKDELVMNAKNLKWDGKTEQLTSGRNDIVSITKGKTLIQGSGFSASGVSKKFSFTGVITGSTETDKDKENTDIAGTPPNNDKEITKEEGAESSKDKVESKEEIVENKEGEEGE